MTTNVFYNNNNSNNLSPFNFTFTREGKLKKNYFHQFCGNQLENQENILSAAI